MHVHICSGMYIVHAMYILEHLRTYFVNILCILVHTLYVPVLSIVDNPNGVRWCSSAGWQAQQNVYEVNPWLWQFGRIKPRLGCLMVVKQCQPVAATLRTGIVSDVLNLLASEHPLGPVKTNKKAQSSNAPSSVQVFASIYFRVQMRSSAKSRSNMECMDFSSVNGLSCIVSKNQLVSMLLWWRTEKSWRKRTLNPKSIGSWKLKSFDDELLIMSSNLHAGSMQQSRHNNFDV
jgi:hypothetical protein